MISCCHHSPAAARQQQHPDIRPRGAVRGGGQQLAQAGAGLRVIHTSRAGCPASRAAATTVLVQGPDPLLAPPGSRDRLRQPQRQPRLARLPRQTGRGVAGAALEDPRGVGLRQQRQPGARYALIPVAIQNDLCHSVSLVTLRLCHLVTCRYFAIALRTCLLVYPALILVLSPLALHTDALIMIMANSVKIKINCTRSSGRGHGSDRDHRQRP